MSPRHIFADNYTHGIHDTAGFTRYAISAGIIESSVQLAGRAHPVRHGVNTP